MARTIHPPSGTSSELAAGRSRGQPNLKPEPVPVADSLVPAGNFHFVTVEAAPTQARQLATRRQARSHAVKQALENKRQLQREAGNNFRVATWKDVAVPPRKKKPKSQKAHTTEDQSIPICLSFSASALDPFHTLAVNSSRLQALLSMRKLPLYSLVTMSDGLPLITQYNYTIKRRLGVHLSPSSRLLKSRSGNSITSAASSAPGSSTRRSSMP